MALSKILKKSHNQDSLKNIIEAYLLTNPPLPDFNFTISRNELKGFHPSGLHYACPRAIAFGLLYEKKLYREEVLEEEIGNPESWITPKLRRTFDTGHMIHALIKYIYLKDFPNCEVEVPIKSLYEKYLIGGTADIKMLMMSGRKRIWDVKTMKDSEFNKLDENNLQTVKEAYVGQGDLYMLGLKIFDYGILAWNKDNGDLKEILFSFDRERVKPLLVTATKGRNFLLGGKVPILDECKKSTGRYKSCPYSSICFRCKDKNILGYTNKKSNGELIA
jgi:hypothetical protein